MPAWRPDPGLGTRTAGRGDDRGSHRITSVGPMEEPTSRLSEIPRGSPEGKKWMTSSGFGAVLAPGLPDDFTRTAGRGPAPVPLRLYSCEGAEDVRTLPAMARETAGFRRGAIRRSGRTLPGRKTLFVIQALTLRFTRRPAAKALNAR